MLKRLEEAEVRVPNVQPRSMKETQKGHYDDVIAQPISIEITSKIST